MDDVFDRLKKILRPYQRRLRVLEDTDTSYSLASKTLVHRGKPLYFGGVAKRKNYVSYYLMAVYGSRQLQESISPALKRRMQGKSCFNFTTADDALFKELATLTRASAQLYTDGRMAKQLAQLAG